ncbi:hypothetical protein GOODEAATRI_005905 [Goodea atripinnis]|uniref:IF rod domain-containing protein n=1 Tax=Goodea atripinnis TaxID=208336 RepID=A0ABV0PW48_9TELE
MSYTRSAPQYRANSIYGGAGGQGARISSASASSLRSGIPISSSSSSFKLSSMMGGGAGGAFGGAGAAAASGSSAGILGNEKGAMQNLNDRLANYLETVRNLEQANKNLEMNIREALEKGGQDVRDYSKYEPFIEDLRNQEVVELRNQISHSGVQVDVDAPKDVQVQVSQNTEALQGAQGEKSDLTRQIQTLEIELASQQNLKASLEDTLRNTELRYNMQTEKSNGIILRLEEELTNLRENIQHQTQEYEALLNMKMKLEAEISTYKSLLDGEDFK